MKFFGTRISTIRAERAMTSPRDTIKLRAQIVVSVILLGAGIYFVGWHPDVVLADLAKGWIGLLVGYWIS